MGPWNVIAEVSKSADKLFQGPPGNNSAGPNIRAYNCTRRIADSRQFQPPSEMFPCKLTSEEAAVGMATMAVCHLISKVLAVFLRIGRTHGFGRRFRGPSRFDKIATYKFTEEVELWFGNFMIDRFSRTKISDDSGKVVVRKLLERHKRHHGMPGRINAIAHRSQKLSVAEPADTGLPMGR